MLALLSLPAQGAPRYQVCDFTCAEPANASWLACRAEKCTPRLPEDLCADGSEPTLTPEPGAKEGEGRAVAGPAECAEAGVPALGSFAERCELCLSLAQGAINLARRPARVDVHAHSRAAAVPARAARAACRGTALGRPPRRAPRLGAALRRDLSRRRQRPERPAGRKACPTVRHRGTCRRELTPSELSELGPSALCERAGREVASLLPTVRTCRMLPEACAEAVASWQNRTCPLVFEPLTRGASMGQMMSAQQAACGRLLTQRPGSGVHEAEVCPALRDIGGRIMSIAGLVAAALFAAQLNHF